MNFITIDEIKDQLRIERDFAEEDALLTIAGNAAEAALLRTCNRTAENLLATFGATDKATGDLLPPPDFKLACLMMTTHLYEHRGPADSVHQIPVPYSVDMMVRPFVKLSNDE